MGFWSILLLSIVALIAAGALWFRWKLKQEERRLEARRREAYVAKRRVIAAGSTIKARTPSFATLVGSVVQVVNQDEVIARLRHEDAPPYQAEEGPFPIKYILEIDGQYYGWD